MDRDVLILTYMIEASLLRLLAKTASKKSAPISFYRAQTRCECSWLSMVMAETNFKLYGCVVDSLRVLLLDEKTTVSATLAAAPNSSSRLKSGRLKTVQIDQHGACDLYY